MRSVNVTLIVPPAIKTPSTGGRTIRDVTGSCLASKLVPTQTGLVSNFAAPAAWPTPLEILLVNDCGVPVPNGQVIATFSNGDPPLIMGVSDPSAGKYAATWTPRKSSQQVTISATASAAGFTTGTTRIPGAVIANVVPILNHNAVLNIYNADPGAPMAPGTLVQIQGSYLASSSLASTSVPLPTTLGGTSVIIGGVQAPISSVTPGQVNVQVPFELSAGQPYQVIISANGALTTPDGLQVAATSPGLSLLPGGAVAAGHSDGTAVTAASPAKPGEFVVVYMAGLGVTDVVVPSGTGSPSSPPAKVTNAPSITLNNVPVSYTFAGLTPGLVGVYQINLQVPVDAADGNLILQITQAGAASNSGTLPVRH